MTPIRIRVAAAKEALKCGDEYRRLLSQGLVPADTAWYCAKGAEEFLAAVAAGDLAGEADRAERRRVCRGCPRLTERRAEGADAASHWCGEPGRDHTQHPAPDMRTCGCLIAGKTWVASAHCPQHKWGPVAPGGS